MQHTLPHVQTIHGTGNTKTANKSTEATLKCNETKKKHSRDEGVHVTLLVVSLLLQTR